MPNPKSAPSDIAALIEAIFHPRSIAVVGASANPNTPGYDYVSSLQKFGFSGDLYPVNPRAEEILGLPAFPSLRDVPGPADYAMRGPVDYLHSANTQGELVRPFVKWDDEASTVDGVLDSIVRGYKIANTGPKGPVYIAFDLGLQEQELTSPITVHDIDQGCFQAPPPPAASAEVVDQVVDMLISARYPLIVGGRVGYLPAATGPIRELVELLGAAYRDDRTFVCMQTSHPQNLTGSPEVLTKADVVLAVDCADVRSTLGGYGARRHVFKTKGAKRQRVIDLSQNESASRTWNRVGGAIADTEVQMLADPMTGLGQIIDELKKRRLGDKALAARAGRRAQAIAREKAALVKTQRQLLA
ncbi:MAG: CoA-binding protein, partial [Chloroflexi bacterium]|nr:CoA-binding protein [Chloroflexota bacterium]